MLLVWGGTLALGLGATAFWLSKLPDADRLAQHLPMVAALIALTAGVTLVNIALRWGRWHFLARRIGLRMHTRDSLLIYLATLPGILTPFAVGELFRAVLLGRKYAGYRRDIVALWFLERSTDLLILAVFVGLIRREMTWLLGFGLAWLAVLIGVSRLYRHTHFKQCTSPLPCAVLLLSTAAAWILPGMALWAGLELLGSGLSLGTAIDTFASSTILGSVTGLPVGTGVTGSSMIAQLQAHGVPRTTTILATAAFRAGTAWFAVGLGLATALRYRRWLIALWRDQPSADHFDQIAEGYREEIPEHVRRRLLDRKIEAMQQHLAVGSNGRRRRGLDLGCGQGWYACEMAKRGYEMTGVDLSKGQVELARQYADQQHVDARFATASATELPFPDDSFDFAYAVNMAHHVAPKAAQRELFAEAVRVLKPGGVFFLHEMNVTNPAFRLYMSYVFPLLRRIDEGTEIWIRPHHLPATAEAHWQKKIDYFTFLPDFLPSQLLQPLSGLEGALERSPVRSCSAHFMARLVKER